MNVWRRGKLILLGLAVVMMLAAPGCSKPVETGTPASSTPTAAAPGGGGTGAKRVAPSLDQQPAGPGEKTDMKGGLK